MNDFTETLGAEEKAFLKCVCTHPEEEGVRYLHGGLFDPLCAHLTKQNYINHCMEERGE